MQTPPILCRYCGGASTRYGTSTSGKQRYRCTHCKRTFQLCYTANACLPSTNTEIVRLLTEGVSLRGIARLIGISLTTVVRRIRYLARNLKPVTNYLPGDEYGVDELRTYVGNKLSLRWVAAVFNRRTRQIVAFTVGRRNSKTLKSLLAVITKLSPTKIYTDKLSLYNQLIPRKQHITKQRCTNGIERAFLTLRQNLKRLARRTLAFTRKQDMLEASLRLLIFGSPQIKSHNRVEIFK